MLIRQTLAYLPAQLLGPLVQFATAIVLTHFLNAAEYGVTMLVFASQELIYILCLAWWTTYMMRYAGAFADGEAKTRFAQTERGVLLATAIFQMVGTLGVVAISVPQASAFFFASAVFFILSRSYLHFLADQARKAEAILDYSLLQIAAPLLGLALAFAAYLRFDPTPEHILSLFALAQAGVGLVAGHRLGKLPRWGMIDRPILKAALAFGYPVVLSSAFGWLATNGIRFVIQSMLGAAALGLLSVGWWLAQRLTTVAAMLVTAAAYPLAVRAFESGDREAALRQLSDNSALLLAMIVPATFGVIAINEPMTKLLVASEYHAATIAILPWALTGAAIRSFRAHSWDQLYLLFEAPYPMLVVEVVEALVTLAAAAWGAYSGGILGAVIGTTLACAVVTAGDYLYLHLRYAIRAPFWQFARILVAGAGMYLALLALPGLGLAIEARWPSILLAILIGGVLYAAAMAMLFPLMAREAFRYVSLRLRRGG
ncbi:MAG: polysaccharide biosynthesis C-terminal domain-containing protein [Proteobacteria bacterium]|nr:polysaccharide biosynthesis C-terminal domain-containing protein [Pseudomonadota bacterium]